jgi:arylsulfatase A-like enzyme
MSQPSRRTFLQTTAVAAVMPSLLSNNTGAQQKKPNVVWICVEDMSAHWSCYGETTITTPNADQLASEGTRFSHAFVTCPVCSPSRSAMITGMYQTTIGAHNHRSSRHDYKINLPEHIKMIPQYFKEAGYHTSNGSMLSTDLDKPTKTGKTDYNFEFDPNVYEGNDWKNRKPGQPFFAQFQLRGGKFRDAKVENPVNPDNVTLPPYYPDHPVLRQDWAEYLNSVLHMDYEVGVILQALKDEGELDNTYIFLWTDHGISHVRDKQFLYDGGIHIPLIIKGPGIETSILNDNLVEHIDIPYTSLEVCSIVVPDHLQGRSLIKDTNPREYIISARDRCDETVERIRAVRTKKYKYIRNYFPDKPHAQPNQYKDGKEIMQTMRQLHAEGKLNDVQSKPFLPTRPTAELYDLENDPYEMNNLIKTVEDSKVPFQMLQHLIEWERITGDLGQFPEPYLAELTHTYKTPYSILQDEKFNSMQTDIFTSWSMCNQMFTQSNPFIEMALNDERVVIRYQSLMACQWLNQPSDNVKNIILTSLQDESQLIKLAAAYAANGIGEKDQARDVWVTLLKESKNEVIRHYATLGLEHMGEDARPALPAIINARDNDPYEYVKRVTTRIAGTLEI